MQARTDRWRTCDGKRQRALRGVVRIAHRKSREGRVVPVPPETSSPLPIDHQAQRRERKETHHDLQPSARWTDRGRRRHAHEEEGEAEEGQEQEGEADPMHRVDQRSTAGPRRPPMQDHGRPWRDTLPRSHSQGGWPCSTDLVAGAEVGT